jgi:CheY-like chemotaxis protein
MNQQKHILIVEDDPAQQRFIKNTIARKSSDMAYCASNCHDAISICNSVHFDLIFMDYILPDGDGVNTSKEILKANPCAHIVMITGNDMQTINNAAYKAGLKQVLYKPVSPGDILTAVSKHILNY